MAGAARLKEGQLAHAPPSSLHFWLPSARWRLRAPLRSRVDWGRRLRVARRKAPAESAAGFERLARDAADAPAPEQSLQQDAGRFDAALPHEFTSCRAGRRSRI